MDPNTELTPEQRAGAVLTAAVALMQERKPGTLTAEDIPRMDALSDKAGFKVEPAERKAALEVIAANAGAGDDNLPDLEGLDADAKDSDGGTSAGPHIGANDPLAALPTVDKQPAGEDQAPANTPQNYPTTLYHATLAALNVKTPAEWRAARAKGYQDLMKFPLEQRIAIHKRAQNTGM